MSQASTAVSKIGPNAGTGQLFDPRKTYKFRHLQFCGLVRDRADLAAKQKFGFPVGRLLSPRDRQWTGFELNDYLESRPVTQAEMDALPNRAPKTSPTISRKPKNVKRGRKT